MGRSKIDLDCPVASNKVRATFSKRKEGLRKKARELGILCNCSVALVIIPPIGCNDDQVIEVAVHGTIRTIFQKYLERQHDEPVTDLWNEASSSEAGFGEPQIYLASQNRAQQLEIDSAQASQLAAQHQHHHQLQQQAQMQRQPPQHQQQMVAGSQLAQLTSQGHNQVSPQLAAQNKQQVQQLQHSMQQQQNYQVGQYQQHHQLLHQPKRILPGNMGNTLTGMNNMNGVGMPANGDLANMVNLGGMNYSVGMGGMSPMASMPGMSSTGRVYMDRQLGAMGGTGQQKHMLRPGAMNQQAAALQASEAQQLAAAAGSWGRTGAGMLPNTAGGSVRTQADALSALQGANQVHAGGAGVAVMGGRVNPETNNLGPMQRASVTGLAFSKVPASGNQNYYLNSSQLEAQQQQLQPQGAQQPSSQQQHQHQLLNSQQQQQHQLLNSQQQQEQQQHLLTSQQLNPQQLNTQQLQPQQLNSQQLNLQQQQQQLSRGGSLNSLVEIHPASPQHSSGESLGAVGNMGVSASVDTSEGCL